MRSCAMHPHAFLLSLMTLPLLVLAEQCGPLQHSPKTTIDPATQGLVLLTVLTDVTQQDCYDSCCSLYETNGCNTVVFERSSKGCNLMRCPGENGCPLIPDKKFATTTIGFKQDIITSTINPQQSTVPNTLTQQQVSSLSTQTNTPPNEGVSGTTIGSPLLSSLFSSTSSTDSSTVLASNQSGTTTALIKEELSNSSTITPSRTTALPIRTDSSSSLPLTTTESVPSSSSLESTALLGSESTTTIQATDSTPIDSEPEASVNVTWDQNVAETATASNMTKPELANVNQLTTIMDTAQNATTTQTPSIQNNASSNESTDNDTAPVSTVNITNDNLQTVAETTTIALTDITSTVENKNTNKTNEQPTDFATFASEPFNVSAADKSAENDSMHVMEDNTTLAQTSTVSADNNTDGNTIDNNDNVTNTYMDTTTDASANEGASNNTITTTTSNKITNTNTTNINETDITSNVNESPSTSTLSTEKTTSNMAFNETTSSTSVSTSSSLLSSTSPFLSSGSSNGQSGETEAPQTTTVTASGKESQNTSSGAGDTNRLFVSQDEQLPALLLAAVSIGIMFVFAVCVLMGKRPFDSWQKRHYSRVDYLINGMYN